MRDEAEEGADEGGLAGAVGAEQADGAGAGLDGQVAQGGDRAVRLGDVGQPEQHRDSEGGRRGRLNGGSLAGGRHFATATGFVRPRAKGAVVSGDANGVPGRLFPSRRRRVAFHRESALPSAGGRRPNERPDPRTWAPRG